MDIERFLGSMFIYSCLYTQAHFLLRSSSPLLTLGTYRIRLFFHRVVHRTRTYRLSAFSNHKCTENHRTSRKHHHLALPKQKAKRSLQEPTWSFSDALEPSFAKMRDPEGFPIRRVFLLAQCFVGKGHAA